MKRFFRKAAIWLAGIVAVLVVLLVILYVEEDWRGARAWAAAKAEWEAKGESFDFNKFIPPPVPDDQNLAALPLFKIGAAKSYDGTSYLDLVTLQRAMRSDFPTVDFPPMGNWQMGELPDMAKIRDVMATDYAIVFKGAKPPEDTLAQFNAIYPFLTDFLAAATTHPLFRLNLDYTISPLATRSFAPITTQIKLSRILTLHAILALDHHQPDLALEDIKTNYKLAAGVGRDPSLVAGLVDIAITAVTSQAIADGLARHAWNDAQLADLQSELARSDFLSQYQFTLRGELITETIPFFDYVKGTIKKKSPAFSLYSLWPRGWLDQEKTKIIDFLFRELKSIDPQSRRVFPDVNRKIERETERAQALPWRLVPQNFLFTISAPIFTNQSIKFALTQVWRVDEARIACALERYRLAHGVYPGSLDALVPACIAELPHDIMNGHPYHYQLRPDGTYLLYSVGWNQTDDGGKVVYEKDPSTQIDYKEGDWVWPTPKAKM